MGIKSESKKLEKVVFEFPKLMKHKDLKITVLFVSESEGFIVGGECIRGYTHTVGYWSESWIYNMFEDYNGIITLENE